MNLKKINLDKLSKRISEEIRKEESKESLTNTQKLKIDKNKNNKIDAEDFEILRKQKKSKKEVSEDFEDIIIDLTSDGDEFDYEDINSDSCRHCNGTGHDEFEDVECEWCGGSGYSDGTYGIDSEDVVDEPFVKPVHEGDKKWIQKAIKKPGSLKKQLHVGKDEKIPVGKLKDIKSDLSKKAEGDKKLNKPELKKLRRTNLALTLGQMDESVVYRVYNNEGNYFDINENEMVNVIEDMVLEVKTKSKGLAMYDKVHKSDKKINSDAVNDSMKKIADYVKPTSKGEKFTGDPKHFPKGNGQLAKMDKKAYTPSNAVEEYIENFAQAGGPLDLEYDEIGPNEEWIEMLVKGSSKTGNGDYANSEKTDLGDKLIKRRKLDLYNKEKHKSYNRYPTPTYDTSGEHQKSGKLDKLFKNLNSESVVIESDKLVTEELRKIFDLMSYQKKTQ